MSTSQDPSNSPELPDSFPTCKQDLHVPQPITEADLLAWLSRKLAEAEQALSTRRGMAESYEATSDPAYWEKLSKQPGVFMTKGRGKAPTAQELKQQAASQRRIARKCEQEVAMIKAFISLVETLHEMSAGTPARI